MVYGIDGDLNLIQGFKHLNIWIFIWGGRLHDHKAARDIMHMHELRQDYRSNLYYFAFNSLFIVVVVLAD